MAKYALREAVDNIVTKFSEGNKYPTQGRLTLTRPTSEPLAINVQCFQYNIFCSQVNTFRNNYINYTRLIIIY